MQNLQSQVTYIFLLALAAWLIYLLGPILTPFLLGALLAYLSDPLVKRLERKRIPHLLSVVFVFILLISFFLILVLSLLPLIQNQIQLLIKVLPDIISKAQDLIIPYLRQFINWNTLKISLSSGLPKAVEVVNTVIQSGYTVVDWIVNIILTPVITFYLLRDWDKLRDGLKSFLPAKIKPHVLALAHEYDRVLSEFFRGQLLLMLSLCVLYGIGLSLIGLQVGLIIGVIGGILSIVPYLGSLFVLTIGTLTAIVQFGFGYSVFWVWLVYLIGQGIEGYILMPYLVGDRIGLHPVAVIFAIMAGGTLFGFFGVLLALPIAALVIVLFRHFGHAHHAKTTLTKTR